MKSLKKLLTIVMAMAMMFAFASTAMAAEEPTLTIIANGKTIVNAVTVEVGESVYDAVVKAVGDRAVWKEVDSELGGKGQVLISLDGYASKPYNSEVLKPYDFYDSSVKDDVLREANKVLDEKYPDSDGLGMWLGNGTGFSNEGPYGIYVGEDWMFTIGGERPANDKGIGYYMNEAIIQADDVIVLTYEMVYEPYEY